MTSASQTSELRPSIDLAVADGLARVTLNNPAKLNALTPAMLDEDLPEICAHIEGDDGIRAAVLTGAGRGFCSGADRDGHLTELARRGPTSLPRPLGGFVLPLARLSKPVIAAVNGTTAGGGLALALVCDVRVCTSDAVFVAGYGPAGLVPDGGLTFLLPQFMGPSAAIDFVLGNTTLGGDEAAAAGLVDEVVPTGQSLLERAEARARALSVAALPVIRRTKQLLTAGRLPQLEEHVRRESEQQWICLQERGASDVD
jgi:2-(1,2-epoxy-1,2-dihydrophenyl)acetyl-CoA isomerase